MIRRPPRSTRVRSSAASDVYKRQSKSFKLAERATLRLEGSFTNAPNLTNLGDPNLNIADSNFGRITGARGVDFGGGRTGQVSMRLQF